MIEFEATPLAVKRSPQEVFAYVADVNRQKEWSNAVVDSRLEGFGPVAKGSRFTQTVKILGRTSSADWEVSDYQPDRRIEFRTVSGPVQLRWDVEISGKDGNTLLRSHSWAEPGGFFKMAAPVLRGAMRRQANNDFRTLKTLLEEERA